MLQILKEQPNGEIEYGPGFNYLPINHSRYRYLEEVVLVLKRLSEGHQASKIGSEYFDNDLSTVLMWIEFANDIGLIDSNNNNKLTEKGKKWQKDIGDSFWGSASR